MLVIGRRCELILVLLLFQQLTLTSKFHKGSIGTVSSDLNCSSSSILPESFIRLSRLSKLMGSWFSSNKFSKEELQLALNEANNIISSNPVVVFSKTYCGFCTRVKALLTQLGATYKVIELDQKSDGDTIQSALAEWTGQTTVPNVFIGGKHIGGCDAVTEKHNRGQLVPLLADAGAIANNSAQL